MKSAKKAGKTAKHAVTRKAPKRAKAKAVRKPAARQKKRSHAARQAKTEPGSKKLWLAKPQEKDPGLEEDWHSDLDDEMDFEETSGVSQE